MRTNMVIPKAINIFFPETKKWWCLMNGLYLWKYFATAFGNVLRHDS
jgi:hypothetical protein